MDFIYVLRNGKDILIFLREDEAIQMSRTHLNNTIEIFVKNSYGYSPTHNYYKNGKIYTNFFHRLSRL